MEHITLTHMRQRAIDFVIAHQNDNGSFSACSTDIHGHFTDAPEYESVFHTALVCRSIGDSMPEETRSRSLQYLTSVIHVAGAVNYLGTQHDSCYPDDLDDTSVVYSALHKLDSNAIDPHRMAQFTRILIDNEIKPGGPYYTWQVPDHTRSRWDDIDPVVNANIAHFLGTQSVTLSPLTEYFQSMCKNRESILSIKSKYYHDIVAIYYFLSCSQTIHVSKHIIEYLRTLQEKDGSWGSPFRTILALGTLIHLKIQDDSVERGMLYLYKHYQGAAFVPDKLYIEKFERGTAYYSGSACTVAACLVDVLTNYIELIVDTKSQAAPNDNHAKYITDLVTTSISTGTPSLDQLNRASIQLFLAQDTRHEITDSPMEFAKTLRTSKLQPQQITNTCVVNTLGWIAHSIYDAVVDDHSQQDALPLANLCMLVAHKRFARLPSAARLQFFYESLQTQQVHFMRDVAHRISVSKTYTLQELEAMNRTPQTPPSTCLASIPLTLLKLASATREEESWVTEFYKRYAYIRQLNDDAHDWEDDLQHGNITTVVSILMREFCVQNKQRADASTTYSLTQIIPELRSIYHRYGLIDISHLILEKIAAAYEHIDTYTPDSHSVITLQTLNYVQGLLMPYIQSTRTVQTTHSEVQEFYTSFSYLQKS